MNVVKPFAKLYNDNEPDQPYNMNEGIKQLRKIEFMGRISHRSEEAMTAISYDKFLRAVVLSKGDWSIVEHGWLTVIFYVDRGITHEIVRHRVASYTQESTRFVNYEKKMPASFIMPDGLSIKMERADNGEQVELSQQQIWEHAIQTSEQCYKQLIQSGVTPQIARSVFPNALGSKIAMSCNLRNWRHFLLMRTTREAHPQMREVTYPLLEQMKYFFPIIFEDIEVGATQADNLKKMR